ncbi:unnamed protein product [Paramecium sonneborni]|uniref:Ion transport domain-containing protein n=1 Tax=Paramecium sonneborni TaxID=65129 RepID=A0A8S1R720_9CILI|nr:unnamed protein product [Paramecium sonneborni]
MVWMIFQQQQLPYCKRNIFRNYFNISYCISYYNSTIVYTSRFYSSFIGFKGEIYYISLQQSFYTFVQLLTLDDWDANVLPVFESQQIIMPYILFPCFIIVSNVILLNILIA